MAMGNEHGEIDAFSFQLGMINCFVEMVACGVKPLALSPPLPPAEYEAVKPYSDRMVNEFRIQSHLEKSLMVTSLQSPGFTRNKWSILYFKNRGVLTSYFELKERQKERIDSNRYDDLAQKEISVSFMRLLGYPPDVIESKLSGAHPDPFIITD